MPKDGPDDAPLLPPARGPARRWLRAFWLAILAGYAIVFAVGLRHVGLKDHDMFLVFHAIQCWNQELFGLDRQWTPVLCGGLSAAGNPQIPILSPAALAGYALGPFWGLRLVSILYFVAGFAGAYRFAGLWLHTREPRALAAALFVGNGYFVCRFAYGHVTFLAFLVLPALLWGLHAAGPWARAAAGRRRLARRVLAVLLLGAVLALLVDGNPHVIMYMLPWVGVYTLALAGVRRSWSPLVLFAGALAVAAVLDAAYLWSLVDSQWIHPRLRADQFTNPLALLVFMLVPFRGNMPGIPTPDNGYELSVFLGVVVGWALLRHGGALWRRMPRELRVPLLATVVVSVVLGMGSLRAIGVPGFLSPFDLLRELPGFRSLGVTARYWGFLALPLSLVGAAALWRFATTRRNPHVLGVWMIAAFALQLAFQVGTIWPKLVPSRAYEAVPVERFAKEGERITYRVAGEGVFQGEVLTPTTGVLDCYDMSDFLRPPMDPGNVLVRAATRGGEPAEATGRFRAWSRIRIEAPAAQEAEPADVEWRFLLNQAWHPYWRAEPGRIERTAQGNLVAVARQGALAAAGGLDVVFDDAVSRRGTRTSLVAWPAALLLMLCLLPCARRATVNARRAETSDP